MKNIIFILTVLFMFTGLQSFAAVPATGTIASSSIEAKGTAAAKVQKLSWFQVKAERFIRMLHPEHRRPDLGKLALVFGICGFIPLIGWMPAITAIILGALGIHKKKDKRAMAGMILGIVSLSLGIIIVAAIFIALSA